MNNVVIVSGGEQRDSAIHIQISILPQTPLPSRAVAGSFDLHPVIFLGAALVRGFIIAVASLPTEHRLEAHRFRSCSTWSLQRRLQ